NAGNGKYKIEVKPNGDDDETEQTSTSSIEVRRYELPSFRVTAQTDRPFYLPGQEPSIEIRADYLFGKPVTGGKVRLSAGNEEAVLRAGILDSAGRFRTAIVLEQSDERLKNTRYTDLHYTAYVTDATTNRTEQRQFDIRLSRDPIHIYVVRSEALAAGVRFYIATYTADGKPAICDVEALSSSRTIAGGRSNRFGL